MPIPNTPLIANISQQIDRDIRAYLESENYRYMPATPNTLATINETLRNRFRTSGIEASYTTPIGRGNPVRVNIKISDGYVLRRLRAINEDEYNRVVMWMTMSGFDIPPIDIDPFVDEVPEPSGIKPDSGLQIFDGTEPSDTSTMAAKILQAERERQQFIREHMEICGETPITPTPAKFDSESVLTIHDGGHAIPGKRLIAYADELLHKTAEKKESSLTIY